MPSPIIEYLPDPRDEHVAVCAVCAFPLTKHQVAADFSGTIINYEEHITLPCSFCFCSECLEKITANTNDGPEEAYRKLYASSVITRQRSIEDEYPQNSTEE